MADWYLYLIRCRDNSLYTGITTDVSRRFTEHQAGGKTGARYLRGRGPLELVFHHVLGNHSIALTIENQVKRLAKADKEILIADPSLIHDIIRKTEEARSSSDED